MSKTLVQVMERKDGVIRYFVCVDGKSAPRVPHDDVEKALREAKRLARKSRKTARIFMQIGAVFPTQRGILVANFGQGQWYTEQNDEDRRVCAQAILEKLAPKIRAKLGSAPWDVFDEEGYPLQRPPKTDLPPKGSLHYWAPADKINEVYAALWGNQKAVLRVVAMHFGWTIGEAYVATEDWFRSTRNYN
ncbi:hypothetical protein CcrC1_gp333 [Caulobacter phage C1]|nr:hypothetical protein CcrC1_gp333 [Caulobacter phage C1]UTU08562.1 hypothetical protein CcrC2_gp334 [Caulobacter phage C2]UTU09078.1 hypothetical protein CcrJ4_gp329 [Caulobacter phage J4]UTU09637.1 hypothetical protein CcrBL47_gp351 [Caulobacter phage BL47]UTU10195.1 hypothetical protein CcrRB23_gp333 [Caulobacter phage RB23]WGN97229.1 hypothetical protein [Bertelyvirus sp.]